MSELLIGLCIGLFIGASLGVVIMGLLCSRSLELARSDADYWRSSCAVSKTTA